MTTALIISHIVLWLLVIALAAVVFALTRQIGVLHERIAPVGALTPEPTVHVGDPAPELALADLSGRQVKIGGKHPGRARTLLFFLSPNCPVCKSLLPTLERVARAEVPPVRVLLASDGPAGEHRAFVEEQRIGHLPYLLSTALGVAFGVGKLPYAVLIDETGIVAAQGIVNTREHVESLFEAQRYGVSSIQQYLEEQG